ncbi:hypothetical protein PG994_009993 [Apiospora phragmitis]|uniref:EKC/KEOPS complex subunit BUD32 n=1 Tax=Apiospora phragmitis TaxID=2905665 RepID=A0ABR1TNT8_9PEZI
MTTDDPDTFYPWYPADFDTGKIITSGSSAFIALFNGKQDTFLKFPLVPRNDSGNFTDSERSYRQKFRDQILNSLEVEIRILEILGDHSRIIRLKGKHEDGLLIEYMPNGSVKAYLRNNPGTPSLQRLKWAFQAAEGLAYVHQKNVLHCDVSIGNILLDPDLNVKLSDFGGRILNHEGEVIHNGGALEGVLSSMPRTDPNFCNEKTDIFALGMAIYFVATGEMPFPHLATNAFDHENEIQSLFQTGEFPFLDGLLIGDIVLKCWNGVYKSAVNLTFDLHKLYSTIAENPAII